jgi:hypothetical protein
MKAGDVMMQFIFSPSGKGVGWVILTLAVIIFPPIANWLVASITLALAWKQLAIAFNNVDAAIAAGQAAAQPVAESAAGDTASNGWQAPEPDSAVAAFTTPFAGRSTNHR